MRLGFRRHEHPAFRGRVDVSQARDYSVQTFLAGKFNGRTTVKVHFIGVLIMACCAMGSARTARAQETVNYASLGGRVTDPQGAVVPGAAVSVAGVQQMFDAQGRCTNADVEALLRGMAPALLTFLKDYICPKHILEEMVRSGAQPWAATVA